MRENLRLYNRPTMTYVFETLPDTIHTLQEFRTMERELRDPLFVTVMGTTEDYDYAPARRYHAADSVLLRDDQDGGKGVKE